MINECRERSPISKVVQDQGPRGLNVIMQTLGKYTFVSAKIHTYINERI